MLRILKEALGLEKKKRSVLYDDLDHLGGTWSDQDAAEFERATAVFEAVDKDMWNGVNLFGSSGVERMLASR